MPPGIDEAQMQRLEKESERFTTDIKHREKENERLREQIASLQCQIQQSSKDLEEVTHVSDVLGIAICTAAFLFDQCECCIANDTPQLVLSHFRDDKPPLINS